MTIALTLHLLAAVLWIGGMFFAHQILRPIAAAQLEPPQRLPLWSGVFSRFFPWVWVSVVTLLISGYWMIFGHFGGFANTGKYVHIMHGLGLIMIAIFAFVYFVTYRRLQQAVASQSWPEGKAALDRIRQLVGINTVIGVITLFVASGGKYLFG
jgi:uncharacterized membrane protein